MVCQAPKAGSSRIADDKGRSHQQSQVPFLSGIELRADTTRSRGASETTDISKTLSAGKVREIAIAAEVDDSVLYHSLFELASPRRVLGALVR
jgi:hypothetical protein